MSRGAGHAQNGSVVLELKGIRQSFPQADGGRLEVIRRADLDYPGSPWADGPVIVYEMEKARWPTQRC